MAEVKVQKLRDQACDVQVLTSPKGKPGDPEETVKDRIFQGY